MGQREGNIEREKFPWDTYSPEFLHLGTSRPYDGAHEGLGDENLHLFAIGVPGLATPWVLHRRQLLDHKRLQLPTKPRSFTNDIRLIGTTSLIWITSIYFLFSKKKKKKKKGQGNLSPLI